MKRKTLFAEMAMGLGCLIATPAYAQMLSKQTQAAEVQNSYKRYHGDGIDDVLRFAPYAAVYGLKIAGVDSQSSWKRMLTTSVVGVGLNVGITYALKHTVHEMRPDGTDNHSFPSGHTSFAFCGATVLMHEYRHLSPWIGVAGYAVATGVAVDRVCRNRHHWGDVLAGAAIGVASAEAGYWLGDLVLGKKGKKSPQGGGGKSGREDNLALSVAPTGVECVIQF